jgi:hypothetical protein
MVVAALVLEVLVDPPVTSSARSCPGLDHDRLIGREGFDLREVDGDLARPGDPAKAEILRSEPTRPNDRLGEIMIDASTDPAPPITEVEAKLRKEAAKLGPTRWSSSTIEPADRRLGPGPLVGPERRDHHRPPGGRRRDQVQAVKRARRLLILADAP